jgi:O-antigen ligase
MILLSAFFLPFSTAGLEISAYLALLGFLIGGQYLEKLHFIKKEALVLSALGLMAIVLIWSLYSSGTPHDIVTRIKAYEKLFMILVALWTFTQHPQMRSVFLGILIGAILMNFVLGMLKFHHLLPSQWSSAFQSDSSASFGSFKGSGHIAMSYIASILTFGFGVILIFHHRSLSALKRIILAGSLIFCCYYLFAVNDGRSGFLILAILAAYLLIRMIFNIKAYKLSVLLLLAGILLVGLAYHNSSLFRASIANGKSDLTLYQEGNHVSSWGYRLYMWDNTLKLIKASPVIGYGTGSIAEDWKTMLNSPDNVKNPHNQYLFFWVENGIFGLCAFLAFLFFAGRNGISTEICSNPSTLPSSTREEVTELRPSSGLEVGISTQTLKILLEGFVLAFAIGCLYNSWLHDVHEGFFFILGLAALRSMIAPRISKP